MGKRQETALETKQKLVAAGRELLDEKAAECINIEEITKKAGVSKGSFYTYFKRKEDLISEIALDEYNTVTERVADLPADCGVYKRLSTYLITSVEIIEKNSLEVAQQWMKNVVSPLEDTRCGTQKYHFDRANIRHILENAVLHGELSPDTPVDILATGIVDSYYGSVAVWCIQRGNAGALIHNMEIYCSHILKTIIRQYQGGTNNGIS